MYKFKKNFKNVMKKRMRGTYYNYACGFPENNTAVVFCNTENDLWKNDGGILFEYEIENVVIEDSIINFRDFHKDLAEKLQLNSINTDYDCVPDFNIKNINYIVDMKLLHASGPLKHFMPTKYQCFYRDIVGYEKKTKIVFCMTDTGTTIQYVRNNENMFDVSEESGNKEKNIRDYLYICNDLIENYKKAYEASLIYDQFRNLHQLYDTESEESEQSEHCDLLEDSYLPHLSDQSDLYSGLSDRFSDYSGLSDHSTDYSGDSDFGNSFVEYSTDSEELQISEMPAFVFKNKIYEITDVQVENNCFQSLVLNDKICEDLYTIKVFKRQDDMELYENLYCHLSVNKIKKFMLNVSPSIGARARPGIADPANQIVCNKVGITLMGGFGEETDAVVNYECIILKNNYSIPRKTLVLVITKFGTGMTAKDFYHVSGDPNGFMVKKIKIKDD
ncbi:uncharacterized protein LOC119673394 [Teleopsis dalmanni]|uniref:uncharacterized protein LOC119673394 n=1 Tax=Teleopsis dalmanni TaxID=139649 RepID=UPI0018CD4554|nr:uncharacterized protein LOC119673394 [Teleopsis dalmanni]